MKRGSHVSIRHPDAVRIYQAMIDERKTPIVIPDFRAPDNIRLGISPLYNTFEDVWKAINLIENIVEEELFLKYPQEIKGVT